MYKHNICAVLNLQRKSKKKGLYALRIRATVKGKQSYYGTGISLAKEQWNNLTQKIVGHPDAVKLNNVWQKVADDIRSQFIDAALRNAEVTKLAGSASSKDFIKFIETKLLKSKDLSADTMTQKHVSLDMLRAFQRSIPFRQIGPDLIDSYIKWLKEERKNEGNTIWSRMKLIKEMLREAEKAGYISAKWMKDYKWPRYAQPARDYLPLSEVDKIEAFRNATTVRGLQKVADWFLFSIYTGLRWGDVKQFSPDRVVNGKIVLRTSKGAGEDIALPIHDRLQVVLTRMEPGVYTNIKCNEYLKLVAAGSGISRNVTFHMGRHSFAVIFLELGGSMEALKTLLGHTSIRNTEIYGKITNKRVEKEVKDTWGKLKP